MTIVHINSRYSKYHNVVGDGYASRFERLRGEELELLEKAGEISELRRQVRYELIPHQDGERPCTYVADFVYRNHSGELVVEDVKGYKRGAAYNLYVIKRKLMRWRFGIEIRET